MCSNKHEAVNGGEDEYGCESVCAVMGPCAQVHLCRRYQELNTLEWQLEKKQNTVSARWADRKDGCGMSFMDELKFIRSQTEESCTLQAGHPLCGETGASQVEGLQSLTHIF